MLVLTELVLQINIKIKTSQLQLLRLRIALPFWIWDIEFSQVRFGITPLHVMPFVPVKLLKSSFFVQCVGSWAHIAIRICIIAISFVQCAHMIKVVS